MGNHISEFINDGARSLSLRRLGWAFLLAWVFCVFYTSAAGGMSAAHAGNLGAVGIIYNVAPVASSVVTLVAAVLLERRWGSPVSHSWTFTAAPLLAAVATPLLLIDPSANLAPVAVFLLGAMATGFGSGLLWLMWGEYYARITQEDAEFLAPASAVVAALIGVAISAMQGWVPVVVASLLPMASGACLRMAWRDTENASATEFVSSGDSIQRESSHEEARANLGRVFGEMGRPCFGILVACLFVCVEGALYSGSSEADAIQVAFLVSIAFMMAVGMSAISGPRRVSLAFLYRWMCPVLVVGYASIVVLGSAKGLAIAYIVAIAARFAFCLITQMYFARYTQNGFATPVQAYGLGWISVHLGDMLGVFCTQFVQAGISQGAFSLSQVAALAMALLTISTMFVLNDERSFRAQDKHAESVVVKGSAALEVDRPLREGTLDEESALNARISALAVEAKLTPREIEVFGFLARGRSVPYIRDALVISRETAATHTKHIYAKLDVHSRQELIDLVQRNERET